jgi:nitrite reductase/ring-hydroxylating ferredoxin subunit
MTDAAPIVDVDEVPEVGTYLFTVTERNGREEEVILVRIENEARDGDGDGDAGADTDGDGRDDDESDGHEGGENHDGRIAAWKNFCMHEPDQRLDRGVGRGAAMRDGELICPRHGSMFDAATGYCDNGEAAGQTLVGVDVAVRDGTVYLTDEGLTYEHAGGIDEDDGPSSTSHISF